MRWPTEYNPVVSPGMDQTARFEILLPVGRRLELDALATELGCTSSALVRFAITRVLADRDRLIGKSDSVRVFSDNAA